MGRLKLKRATRRRIIAVTYGWLLPALIVGSILFFAHSRIFAQQGPTQDEVQTALQNKTLKIGEDTYNNYRQIYYTIGDKKQYLTDNAINHTAPKLSGSRAIWLEERSSGSQVFIYDLLARQKLQLTFSGSHQNPQIDGNTIIWEHWVNEGWQVEYFDGNSIKQISSDYPSSRSRLSGDKIAYAQRLPSGQWRVNVYTISMGQTTQEYQGASKAAWPEFVDGELKLPLSRLQ